MPTATTPAVGKERERKEGKKGGERFTNTDVLAKS
jgi:hypothetical protein